MHYVSSRALNRPQMTQFTLWLTEIGHFGPQIDFLEPHVHFYDVYNASMA